LQNAKFGHFGLGCYLFGVPLSRAGTFPIGIAANQRRAGGLGCQLRIAKLAEHETTSYMGYWHLAVYGESKVVSKAAPHT